MPATPYRADPYTGSPIGKPFSEANVPKTNVGFIGSLVRLSRLRGFGTKAPTTKSPVRSRSK